MEDSAQRGGLKKLGAKLDKLGGKAAGLVNNKKQQQDTARGAQAAAAAAVTGASGQAASHPPDPVLEQLLRHVRSERVRRQFFAHPATEYTAGHDVRIFAGTYNVAGRRPPAGQRLHEWVHAWRDSWPPGDEGSGGGGGGAAAGAPGPDIVVIGFQEVVALNAGNALLGPSSEGADGWDAVLAATLNGDEWATKNLGRTFGSSLASNPGALAIDRLGSQAAYAYSVISGQTASAVVGAMDRLWAGDAGSGTAGASGGSTPQPPAPPADLDAAAAEQQAARLRAAIAAGDSEEVFVQVAAKQMVGLYLSVWARKRVARHVRGVQTTSAATGWGGFVGNKGAVAVRMRVYDTPLCVVCAHLASGDAEGDEARRNADASEILRRCCFPTDAQMAALGLTSAGPPGHWGDLSSIPSHGNVIWLGDLNYRVSLPDEEARRLIAAGRLERLLESDQLRREMAAGRAFQGWREGPITFPPTYKYHIGTDTYSGDPAPSPPPGLARGGASGASLASLTAADSDPEGPPRADAGAASGLPGSGLPGPGLRGPVGRSSSRPKSRIGGGEGRGGGESPAPAAGAKRRTPAWTDRVLWLKGHALHQLAYGRAELAVSDHRPVAAAFLLQAHRYDRSLIESLLEEARRLVDASDMANRPRCSLEPKFLDVGAVAFAAPASAAVCLTNDGPCDAFFYFVAPPRPRSRGGGGGPVLWDDDQPPFPPWLRVTPEEGTVEAGATKELTLTVMVTGGPSATALADAPPAAGGATRQQQQHSHTHQQQQQQQGDGSHHHQQQQQVSAEGALDAILILRVVDGSDFFIALNGSFIRSCFGRDLSDLASLGDAPAAPLAALSPAAAELRAAALEAAAAAAAAEAAQAAQHQQQQQQEAEEGGGGAAAAAAAEPSPPVRQPAAAIEAPPLVPKEVRRLTAFLAAHLSTPGLFVHSYEIACGLFPPRGRQPRGAQQAERLAAATAGVRWALDTGEALPQGTTPHQAAATLLSLFQQLPAPLVPPAVSAVLSRAVPQGPAAARLLAAAMPPVGWATARHVLDLLRAALEPAVAATNGLTLYAVSEAFAEYWFNGGGGGGGGAGSAVPSELAGNRIAFLMMLLDNPTTDDDEAGGGGGGDAAGNYGGGGGDGDNAAAAAAGGWDAPESGPGLLD